MQIEVLNDPDLEREARGARVVEFAPSILLGGMMSVYAIGIAIGIFTMRFYG